MMKLILVVALLITTSEILFAQCIDKEKIQEGYSFGSNKYSSADTVTYTEVYVFGPNGEVWQDGNYLVNNAVDIKQATINALKYKAKVENAIKAYAGKRFFSKLQFKLSAVVYPQRVEVYSTDTGHRKIEVMFKEIKDHFKYIYQYSFNVDSLTSCLFQFEVNRFGEISPLHNIPSKRLYKPVTQFSYCRLINIARKQQKHIDPIASISLCFNEKSKRFCWIIVQGVGNKTPGTHYVNMLQIDAVNLLKVKQTKVQVEVSKPEE